MENREKEMRKKGRTVVLIGFMGSGKTSVGRRLSGILKIPVLDTDELIAEREGMPVSAIFDRKGELYFRNAETALLRELPDKERGSYILSVGGGLPLRAENRPLLRKIGTVIYLKTGVPVLCRRLQGDTKRPVLQQGEGTLEEKIRRILSLREPLYEEAADRVIVTDALTVTETAKKAAAIWKESRG